MVLASNPRSHISWLLVSWILGLFVNRGMVLMAISRKLANGHPLSVRCECLDSSHGKSKTPLTSMQRWSESEPSDMLQAQHWTSLGLSCCLFWFTWSGFLFDCGETFYFRRYYMILLFSDEFKSGFNHSTSSTFCVYYAGWIWLKNMMIVPLALKLSLFCHNLEVQLFDSGKVFSISYSDLPECVEKIWRCWSSTWSSAYCWLGRQRANQSVSSGRNPNERGQLHQSLPFSLGRCLVCPGWLEFFCSCAISKFQAHISSSRCTWWPRMQNLPLCSGFTWCTRCSWELFHLNLCRQGGHQRPKGSPSPAGHRLTLAPTHRLACAPGGMEGSGAATSQASKWGSQGWTMRWSEKLKRSILNNLDLIKKERQLKHLEPCNWLNCWCSSIEIKILRLVGQRGSMPKRFASALDRRQPWVVFCKLCATSATGFKHLCVFIRLEATLTEMAVSA